LHWQQLKWVSARDGRISDEERLGYAAGATEEVSKRLCWMRYEYGRSWSIVESIKKVFPASPLGASAPQATLSSQASLMALNHASANGNPRMAG
jgi:hypothetical protein